MAALDKQSTSGVPVAIGGRFRVLKKAKSFKDDLKSIFHKPLLNNSNPKSISSSQSQPGSPTVASKLKDKIKYGLKRTASFNLEACSSSGMISSTSGILSSSGQNHLFETHIVRVQDKCDAVLKTLLYVSDVVDKSSVLQLPGAVTVVLESIMELNQIIGIYLDQVTSVLLKPQQNEVYHGLARLVRWVDHVTQAVDCRPTLPKLSEQTMVAAQSVIETLIRSIAKLVKAAIDKIKVVSIACETHANSLPTSARKHSIIKEVNMGSSTEERTISDMKPPVMPLGPKDILRMVPAVDTPLRQTTPSYDSPAANSDLPPPKPPLPCYPMRWCTFGENFSTSTLDFDVGRKDKESPPTNNNSPLSPCSLPASSPPADAPPLPDKKSARSASISFRAGKPHYSSSFKRTPSQETDVTTITCGNSTPAADASILLASTSESPRYLPYAETLVHFFEDESVPAPEDGRTSTPAKRPTSIAIAKPEENPSSASSTGLPSSIADLEGLDIVKSACLDDNISPPAIENSYTSHGVLKSSDNPSNSGQEGQLPVLRTKTVTSSSTTMQVLMAKETFTCRQTFEAEDMDLNGQEVMNERDSGDHPSRLVYSMPASSPMGDVPTYGMIPNDDQITENGENCRTTTINNMVSHKSKRNVMAYMQMLGGNYTSVGIQDFGPMGSKGRHSLHAVNYYQSKWKRYNIQLYEHSVDHKNVPDFNIPKVYRKLSGASNHLNRSYSMSSHSRHRNRTSGSNTIPPFASKDGIKEDIANDNLTSEDHVKLRDKNNHDSNCNKNRDTPFEGTYVQFEKIFPSRANNCVKPGKVICDHETKDLDGDHVTTKCYVTDNETLDSIDVSKDLVMKRESTEEIRGGTVDALIAHATTVGRSGLIFQEVFLTTYRTFISPRQLLKKLLHRHSRFSRVEDAEKKRLSRNAFSFIMRMVDDICFRTELDSQMSYTLMDLVFQLLCNGELMQGRILRNKITEKNQQRKQFLLSGGNNDIIANYISTTKTRPLFDFKSQDIAEQMTLLDEDLFQRIDVSEVLLWSQEQCEERSPNLTRFTEHFNKVSYWCRTRLLEQTDVKEREKLFVKLIKVMKHLRKLNNFNSYLAVLSALDSAPIRRLEWHKQNAENLNQFCELIDSSSSFHAYRHALAETQGLCIPYIGLVLQDLTFIHIGNPDFLSDDIVNFSKRCQQFNILHNVQKFNKCNYEFKKNDKILSCFNNFADFLSEDALWEISEKLKPRGTKKK